jgi:hypothetical protein
MDMTGDNIVVRESDKGIYPAKSVDIDRVGELSDHRICRCNTSFKDRHPDKPVTEKAVEITLNAFG